MKKKIMAVAAAVMAVSMSVPAFAYQVSVVGGTDNRPVAEEIVYNAEHNFTDVSEDDNGVINIALNDGAIIGITDTTFGSEEKITIQDLCLILWNMEGCPDTQGVKAYNANIADKYAVSAIKWAASENIITNTVDPSKTLTIDEVKQMLDVAGYDITAIEGGETDVTKMEALKMIVKSDKRETIHNVGTGIAQEIVK